MAVSELPGNPNAVWTVRRHVEGKKTLILCCVSSIFANMLCQSLPQQEAELIIFIGLN